MTRCHKSFHGIICVGPSSARPKPRRLVSALKAAVLAAGLVAGSLDAFAAAAQDASPTPASTATARGDAEAVHQIAARREQVHARIEAIRAARSRGYAVTALKSIRPPAPARLRLAKTLGGLVLRADRTAVLVPAAALPRDLEVTVSHPADQPGREAASAEKNLKPASLPVAFGPEGTRFNFPVTITLPYDPALAKAQGISPDRLTIHYWNPQLKAWESLLSRVDAAARTISAEVLHFSVYQVLGAGGGTGVAAADAALGFKAAYVFPNPVRGQNTVTIRVQPGVADSVEVRVYDLAGRKIHASSNFNNLGAFDDGNGLGPQFTYDHVWDVSGVGSGVYTYAVTAKKAGQADIVKSGKVAVVK